MTRNQIMKELEQLNAVEQKWPSAADSERSQFLRLCNALAAELEAVETRQACSVVDERPVVERMLAAYNSVLPRVGADLPVFYEAMQAAYRAAQSEAKPELGEDNTLQVLLKFMDKCSDCIEKARAEARDNFEALSLNGKKD